MSRRTLSTWVASVGLVSSGALIATPAVAAEAPAPVPDVPTFMQTVGDFDGDGKPDRAWTRENIETPITNNQIGCKVFFILGSGEKKTVTMTLDATDDVAGNTKDTCPNMVKRANITGDSADQIALGNYRFASPRFFQAWYIGDMSGKTAKTEIRNDFDDTPLFNDFTGDGKDEAYVFDQGGNHPRFLIYKPTGKTLVSVDQTLPAPRNGNRDCGRTDYPAQLKLPERTKNFYVTASKYWCKSDKPGLYFLQADHTFKLVLAEKPGELLGTPRYIDLDADGKKNDIELAVYSGDDFEGKSETRRYRTSPDGSLTLVTDGDAADPKPTPTTTPTTKPTTGPAVDARNDRVVMTHRVHEIGDIPVLRNDKHAEGAKVTIVTPPTVGTAKVLDNGRIHYDRRGKGTQTDVLTYKVTAPNGTTDTARLAITMKGGTSTPKPSPTHSAPIDARNDRVIMTHRVHEIGDIPVLRNDKHAEGAKVTIVTPPTVGTAKVLDNGRIHYDRRGKGTQTDVLTYKVTAPNGTTDTARLAITVKGS